MFNDTDYIIDSFLDAVDKIIEDAPTAMVVHYSISNLIKQYERAYRESEHIFSRLRNMYAGYFPWTKIEYSKFIESCLRQLKN